MKISLICMGKTKPGYIQAGIQEYIKRVNRYASFDYIEIPDFKKGKNLSENEIRKKEGELILAKVNPASTLVLLDEKGRQFSSTDFANSLQSKLSLGKNLCIVIGGAYGFSEEVYQKANEKVSLSRMTFSHQMVRLIFLEQLYRAFSILKGEPYHHS